MSPSTYLRVIPVSVNDVKKFLGDSTSSSVSGANDANAVDSLISSVIETTAEFILQEKFTISELQSLTPNQKDRARWGLCKYIAGSVLEKRSLNATLTDGGSVHLGPLSVSGWSSGGAISTLLKRAKEMMQEGEEMLDSLRITGSSSSSWGVVDGRSHRRR